MKNLQGMDNQMSVMQESMLKMHEQMYSILDAKNLHECERLMQAYREIIYRHLQAMENGETVVDEVLTGE